MKLGSLVNRILVQSCILTRRCRLHHARLAVRWRWTSIGRTAGRLGQMLYSRRRLRAVHGLIGRSPGMQRAVKRADWKRFLRCTSLQWLSCRSDVTWWRIERGQSLVFPDCWNRLHNDCVVFRWTPKCLATVFCAIPAWTILKARLRWFSLSHGMEEGWFLSKLKCFSWRIKFKQTFYTSHLNLYWPVNVVLMNTSKNDMCSLTMKSPCIWVGYYPILSKNITFIDFVHRINMINKYRKIILNFIMHSFFFPLVYYNFVIFIHIINYLRHHESVWIVNHRTRFPTCNSNMW
jgi:hypothetical protein